MAVRHRVAHDPEHWDDSLRGNISGPPPATVRASTETATSAQDPSPTQFLDRYDDSYRRNWTPSSPQ